MTERRVYVDCRGDEYTAIALGGSSYILMLPFTSGKERCGHRLPAFPHPYARFGSAQVVLDRYAKEQGLLDVKPYWEKEPTDG